MSQTITSHLGVLLYFAALLLFLVVVLLLNKQLQRQRRFEARVAALHDPPKRVDGAMLTAVGIKQRKAPRLLDMISRFGELAIGSGLLSRQSVVALQETMRLSGFRNRGALGILIGAKLILFISLPLAVWFALLLSHSQCALQVYILIAAGVVGFVGPDMILSRLRVQSLASLEDGIVDALDMMVICSKAGLGLEPTLERVGREMRFAHPIVAREFAQTLQEMRGGADRRLALVNLGKRTGVASLLRFSATLVESLKNSNPLCDVLSALAAEHRQETVIRFETKAARLAVQLTLLVVAFILPYLFIVAGGPAIVQMLHALHY